VSYLGDYPTPNQGSGRQSGAARSVGGGAVVRATQQWLAIVGTKGPETPKTGRGGRAEAGVLFLKVLRALQGLEVSRHVNLERAAYEGSPALYLDGGFVFLTAQFNVTFDIVGS
jgi:hypothetical protein